MISLSYHSIHSRHWSTASTGGVMTWATVAPAFEFEGFELAAPDWTPDGWAVPGW